jgi:ATP-dependent Zn protease
MGARLAAARRRRPREVAAYHEAGHAVVAELLNHEVTNLVLARSGRNGCCTHRTMPRGVEDFDAAWESAKRSNLAINLAGALAQEILQPDDPGEEVPTDAEVPSDAESCVVLCAINVYRLADRHGLTLRISRGQAALFAGSACDDLANAAEEAIRLAGYRGRREDGLGMRWEEPTRDAVQGVLEEAARQAGALLRSNWHAVENVAVALQREGQLDGARVRELMLSEG